MRPGAGRIAAGARWCRRQEVAHGLVAGFLGLELLASLDGDPAAALALFDRAAVLAGLADLTGSLGLAAGRPHRREADMTLTQVDVVTGAFSYSGAAIAGELRAAGHEVRTLTGHPERAPAGDAAGGRAARLRRSGGPGPVAARRAHPLQHLLGPLRPRPAITRRP